MSKCIFGVYLRPYIDLVAGVLRDPATVFQLVLLFIWLQFFFEMYLSVRQYLVYKKNASIPTQLAGVLDGDTFTKARAYQMDKTQFSFFSSTWGQLVTTAILVFNGIPWLWNASGNVLRSFGHGQEEVVQTLVFVFLGAVISTVLDLPFSMYSTFVIEERHGFNKQTLGFYAKDKLKKFVVSQAIAAPILSLAVVIIKNGGDYFFVYLWGFCFVITLLLMTVYPDYIAPLFDKFTPLPEGELRTEIEKLASSIEFPLKKLYVVEGSKRSSHSNAYFFGFYKNKRIVLFDTLLEDYTPINDDKKDDDKKAAKKKTGCNNEEVLAVLAHELGHWKLNHVLKNLIITEVNLFLCLMVFGLLFKNSTIYAAFGFRHEKPVFIGLLLIFQYIFSVYNEVLTFLMTCLSRRFEFQADAFAKQLSRSAALRSALIKLNKDNLSFPIYDHLYSMFYHSHPPLLERLEALGKID